ncbi:MAG: hypothetical protein IH921_14670 [Gemmatimonadetes bacterium]|nr:hypothetical protein [Gemmatimonadota bacterium]
MADTLGWVLYKRGIASAAITYFREAEARMEPLSPSLGVVRQHLAMAYESDGNVPKARAAIERALAGLEDRQQRLREVGAADEPEPSWVAEVRTIRARLPVGSASEPEESESEAGGEPAAEG